jgi:hypothetical protein
MKFLMIFGISIVIWMLSAWSVMMTAGNIHDSYWKFVPIMNFGQACAITSWGLFFALPIAFMTMLLKEI